MPLQGRKNNFTLSFYIAWLVCKLNWHQLDEHKNYLGWLQTHVQEILLDSAKSRRDYNVCHHAWSKRTRLVIDVRTGVLQHHTQCQMIDLQKETRI